MYNIQQIDIETLKQHSKTIHTKIEVLNYNRTIVDELQGEVIDGTININGDSDIRRTCNLDIVVKSRKLLINKDMLIWLNKFIRIYIGVEHIRSKEILWYKCGTYLFDKTSYQLDSNNNILSLSCLDMMSTLTGTRNGYISGQSIIIPEGNYIRDVLVSIVKQLTPFESYVIEDIERNIPYQMKFSANTTVYQLISQIRDLYPGWETFIDLDEYFVFKRLPLSINDPVYLDETTINDLIKSENRSNDFAEVKNVTEVWGKCLTADWYSDSSIYSGNVYRVSIDNFIFTGNTTVAFRALSNNGDSASIQINNETVYQILNQDGSGISLNRIQADHVYVVHFKSNKCYLSGQFQIYGIAKDTDPNSPFNIYDNGEVLQVLCGGEYDKIYSDELAQQRAEYENWVSTRLNDVVILEMHAIYWLDVNMKIKYQSIITNEINEYIIKQIDYSLLNGTMTVNMVKFYPLYPNE